jgi:hypothetical protein
MTPKRLTELVVNGDRGKLCDELAPLDEKQRAALAADALVLFRRADEIWGPVFFKEMKLTDIDDAEVVNLIKAISAKKHKDWRIPRWTAGLALLGVCDRKALKSNLGSWFSSDILAMPERVLQILDARRPGWLAAWIADQSRGQDPGQSIWAVERGLIRAGALPPNNSDAYIQRMVFGLHSRFGADEAVKSDNLKGMPKTMTDALLADPDLLENEIWRLFEVETQAFDQDWFGWTPALLELSADGKIDRQRLLKSSVRGMSLPLRQGVLSSYGKFHEALKPTLDERAALLADYLGLLGSQIPVVAGHALDALEVLAKAKRLKAADFLEACAPVLHLAKKSQPIKALKMVKQFIKDDPSSRVAAAMVVVGALGHESADVQEAAIGLLESLRAELSPDVRNEIQARSEQVAASLRPRVDALASAPEAKPAASKPAGAAKARKDVPTDLQARARALPPALSAAAGVEAALACVAAQSEPVPTPIEPRRVPRRGSATPVVPLASLDELIEAVTAFIEKVDDIMEVERILDGISRFFLDRPADFDQRVAPLRRRIEALSEPHSMTLLDRAADLGVAQVIRHWLGMPPIQREHGEWWHMPGVFFRLRTRHLIWRLQEDKNALPLLALPTQSDGWLDPAALAERLATQEKAGVHVVDDMDLAQALLRLTPDGRAEALQAVAKRKLYDMDLVRFALGEGKKLPEMRGARGRELLLAAAHARALLDDLADLDLGGIVMPQVGLRPDGSIHLAGPICEDPALPGDLLSRAFSWEAAMPGEEAWGRTGRDDSLVTGWQMLVWPGDRRAVCLLGSMIRASSPVFLKNLLDRDMTWHDEAARLAAWALGTDVPAAKGLVTDALIEALGERTLDPALLGKHLAAILDNLKLNRVAAVLAEAARVSPLHQWSVCKTVDTVLAGLKQTPADLHHLLTVMLETATLTGQQLSEAAGASLKAIPGGSKTAKLAKQLLQLEASPAKMIPVRDAALSASMARAERWASLGFA